MLEVLFNHAPQLLLALVAALYARALRTRCRQWRAQERAEHRWQARQDEKRAEAALRTHERQMDIAAAHRDWERETVASFVRRHGQEQQAA